MGDPFRGGWKLEELGVGEMWGSCKSDWVGLSYRAVPQGEQIAPFQLLPTLPKGF